LQLKYDMLGVTC